MAVYIEPLSNVNVCISELANESSCLWVVLCCYPHYQAPPSFPLLTEKCFFVRARGEPGNKATSLLCGTNFCINKELALDYKSHKHLCLTKNFPLYSNYACIPVQVVLSFHAEKLMLALNPEQWELPQIPWLTATVNRDNTLDQPLLLIPFLCLWYSVCQKELYKLYIRYETNYISGIFIISLYGHVIYSLLICCWTLYLYWCFLY